MVFRKGPSLERWRSLCLERIRIEARMARFDHAAARTTKKGDGNRRSQRHSVHSRPDRFRRRAVDITADDADQRDANLRFVLVVPNERIRPTSRANIDIHADGNPGYLFAADTRGPETIAAGSFDQQLRLPAGCTSCE